MPVNYILYPDRPLIVTTGSGVVTDEELLAHWHNGYTDESISWGTSEALDLRAVERFEATPAGLRKLVDLDVNYATQESVPFKFAIVVSSDYVFGMMRIYQTYSDRNPNFVGVFGDLSGVEEWLGTPLPAA